jgi:hypothetical protein
LGENQPVVVFSVTMMIADPNPERQDSFRWSVYNRRDGGQRLFSLDFDNQTTEISYLLDGPADDFVSTGFRFYRNGVYDLVITMNFADNLWSATLNEELLVSGLALTTIGEDLDLGDIDAVWVMGYGNDAFGENYLVFDNYRIAAGLPIPLPFQLEVVNRFKDAGCLLRLVGEPQRTYAIDVTSDFTQWRSLKTNVAWDGEFEWLDTEAVGSPLRFYRGRAVVP